jgi:2-isopropylmalate synthase
VDATYAAISQATGVNAKVDEYTIKAITSGSQAMGEVTLRVSEGDLKITGRGASTDIIEASGKAFVDALNRLEVRRGRQLQQAQTRLTDTH